MKMKLFEYTIIKHPSEKESKEGKNSEIVKDLERILAKDIAAVNIMAARKIPEDLLNNLENVEIIVRPF